MWDLLSGCHKAGIQVPDVSPVPDDIIAWHNSAAAFPGDTMMSAFNAAKTYFNKEPDILFVVLPERGACLSTANIHIPFKLVCHLTWVVQKVVYIWRIPRLSFNDLQ